jgi:excisionase family DNA binding protein
MQRPKRNKTLALPRERATMNSKLRQVELEASLKALPPIMTPNEAAALLRLKVSTLYRHVSEGRYASAVRRGKPLRFWRDRLVQEFMR